MSRHRSTEIKIVRNGQTILNYDRYTKDLYRNANDLELDNILVYLLDKCYGEPLMNIDMTIELKE